MYIAWIKMAFFSRLSHCKAMDKFIWTVAPFLVEVVFFLYLKDLFAQSLGLALSWTLDTVVLMLCNWSGAGIPSRAWNPWQEFWTMWYASLQVGSCCSWDLSHGVVGVPFSPRAFILKCYFPRQVFPDKSLTGRIPPSQSFSMSLPWFISLYSTYLNILYCTLVLLLSLFTVWRYMVS